MLRLRGPATPPASRSGHWPCGQFLGLNVAAAAHEAMELLNARFQLSGRARKSLGTALRVADVRAGVEASLIEDLRHIAAGADAFRHLCSADMQRSLQRLREMLAERGETQADARIASPPPAGPSAGAGARRDVSTLPPPAHASCRARWADEEDTGH